METLPKIITEYMQTSAGQHMLHGAEWFKWSVPKMHIEESGNTLNYPEKLQSPDYMVFIRTKDGWTRYV